MAAILSYAGRLPYLPPLLWALLLSWLVYGAADWWKERRKPYRQVIYATKGAAAGPSGGTDSRGLRRAVWFMGKGAGLMRVGQSYWDGLDRRLALMGEKAAGKETVTILLLRSLLISLPALALPLLWGDWWKAGFYLPAAAFLFRQELRALDKKYAAWQKELARDIPGVMDRMRICFAGGRDYLSALRQAQSGSGPAMDRALSRLIHDIQSIGSAGAFRLFAVSFDLPAVQKLASALTLAVESGYGAAEAYFNSIEGELAALRQEAAESLVRSKPEKIYKLYALLFGLAVGALGLKGWEILGQVGRLFT
ncbi:MAG: hypothetical protein FWG28_01250 [Clostridiales bacterium]|nr:hypothetical protein [Clostridiales bacterium]